jgi:DNA-binding transcriptional ArsR family regulator
VDIFGALADPVRRSLLAELAAEPRRVADLAAGRPISRPAVSRHLRLLLEAGAVTVEDRGRERYYALDRAALDPVVTYVGGLVARPVPEQALDALETEVRRTTRERRRTA